MTLTLALLLDALFGEPHWLWSRLPHPAVLMGRVIGALDRGFNRGTRRQLRGALSLAILCMGALILGYLLSLLGPVVEALVAAILLAQKSLTQHIRAVSDGLRRSLPDGRKEVSLVVSRNTDAMTEPDVARAAIESAAENLSDGVVAPAFWFLLGGLPGLLLYKAVNTADSMIGYRTPRYEAFGWATARTDDVLNLIPARLTGFAIAVIGGQQRRWSEITADARRHRSPNAGWPEAAMARTLGIALAGPRRYDGQLQDLAWVNGAADRSIGPTEIDHSVTILWKAWGILIAIAASIAAVQLALMPW